MTQIQMHQDELHALWQEIERSLPPLTDPDSYVQWGLAREAFYAEHGSFRCPQPDIDRLAEIKDRYKGQRIFVIGNGPSLNRTPLEKLEDEYTFGTNRIYLLFDRINWRPSFYTTVDWRVAPDCRDEINALTGMSFFFPERFRGLLRGGDDVNWYWHGPSEHPNDNKFSHDLTRGCRGAGSVTGSAIQIAYHLGFDPIYLIGCDCSYKVLDTVKQEGEDRFGTGVKLHLTSTKDDDPNHFDPRYFGTGKRWHDPNVKRMVEGYEQCLEGVRGTGRRIYNATVGGQLEVFERVDFNDLFPKRGAILVPDIAFGRVEPKQVTTSHAAGLQQHPDQTPLVGEVAYEDWAAVEELEIVRTLLEMQEPDGSIQQLRVMFDVGAHHGNALRSFAEAGWRVHAFEPDQNNREVLLGKIQDGWQVTVEPVAVSDSVRHDVAFFSSPESTGISALAPFVESHTQSQRVSTTTLAAYCSKSDVDRVDLLKIDTEGFDLMVLKGFPWDRISPSIVLCEFEDAKSVPLGYTHQQMADYLLSLGYAVYLSEWYPIVRYGQRHRWRRLVRYPATLRDGEAWGNLLAFKSPPDEDLLAKATYTALLADQGKFIRRLSKQVEHNERLVAQVQSLQHDLEAARSHAGTTGAAISAGHIHAQLPPAPVYMPVPTEQSGGFRELLRRQKLFFAGWKGLASLGLAAITAAPAAAHMIASGPSAFAISLLSIPAAILAGSAALAHVVGGVYRTLDWVFPSTYNACQLAARADAVGTSAFHLGAETGDVARAAAKEARIANNKANTTIVAARKADEQGKVLRTQLTQTKATADQATKIAESSVKQSAKAVADAAAANTNAAAALRNQTETVKATGQLAQEATAGVRRATDAAQSASKLASTTEKAFGQHVEKLKAQIEARHLEAVSMLSRVRGDAYTRFSRIATPELESGAKKLGLTLKVGEMRYLERKLQVFEGLCEGRLAGSIDDAIARLLAARTWHGKEIRILEIGVLFGVGAIFMHQMLVPLYDRVRLTLLDPFDGYYGVSHLDPFTGQPVNKAMLERNLRRCSVPQEDVDIINLFSTDDEALRLTREEGPFSLVIIDGDHSYEGIKADFERYADMVAPDGILIVDDYDSNDWPAVTRYAKEVIEKDERFKLVAALGKTGIYRRTTSA